MAKKKTTQVDKPPQPAENVHRGAAMDDTSEKIENLKSLNSMLLKETIEKRQQVDSLLTSKGSLESELTRSEMEKRDLQAELTRLRDCSAQVEFERHLVSLFVSVQVNQQAKVAEEEMEGYWREKLEVAGRLKNAERDLKDLLGEKSEMEKVRNEKDSEIKHLQKKLSELVSEVGKGRNESKRLSQEKEALKSELEARIEESNGLRLKLVESEKREDTLKKEVQKLNSAFNGVVVEKEERDRKIESIQKESDSIKSSLEEANRVIEDLKGDIEGIAREKKLVEEERNLEVKKNRDHEASIFGFKALVLNLQKEEEKLRGSVADLEKKCEEGIEKEKQMAKEINGLVKEKEEKEGSIQSLVAENGVIKNELSDSLKKLDDQIRKTDEILGKKVEADEAKAILENEMAGLIRELSEVKDALSALEASSKNQSAESRKLQQQMAKEINGLVKEKEEKEIEIRSLGSENSLIKKELSESFKKLDDQTQKTNEILGKIVEADEAKARLEDEMAGLMKELSELKGDISALEASSKLQSAENEKLQKEAAEFRETITQITKERDVAYKGYDKEKETVASSQEKILELEKRIEENKMLLGTMKSSKSFWTLVSSLTTVLAAAASVAYATTRGR